jgi:hypothetical protein
MITRLSERNLAHLYQQTQAPAKLHTSLYTPEGVTDTVAADVEAIMRQSPPDLALIALGLCAVVLAEFMTRQEQFADEHAIVTEMKYLGIESVETFGPPYLGEDIGLVDIDELLELCPVQLCALGSLFEDIAVHYPLARVFSEIAYDQADKAEAMLAGEPLPQIETTPSSNAVPSNVVHLDLFTAWRKDNKTTE